MAEQKQRAAAPALDPVLTQACGREEVLACLLATTQALFGAKELDSGLERVATELRRYIAYDCFGVLLLDERGHELRFAFAQGYPDNSERWRFGLGQGIIGFVAQTGQILRAPDVRKEPLFISAPGDETRSELALPLKVKDRIIGVLDLGSRQEGFFTEEHERFLAFLADSMAAAVETHRLYANTRRQAKTLSVLHEVTRELSSILDRRLVLEKVAQRLKILVDYDLFTVFLWHGDREQLESWVTVRKDQEAVTTCQTIALGEGISGTAAALRQIVRVPNVALDPRYVSCTVADDLEVHSQISVPLVFKDRLLGVLDLESTAYDAFSSQHEELLATLASSIAIALVNAEMIENIEESRRQMEEDLTTARRIQERLLPRATPWLPELQIAASTCPARHLGGDFYDFLQPSDTKVGIAVGDVAGKATSAALLASLAVGMLREAVVHDHDGPSALLCQLNTRLKALQLENRFVALALAIYDRGDSRLLISNSGLPYVFHLRGSSVREIEVGGVPLGMLSDAKYDERALHLEPDDVVVLTTDGISEARDHKDREFGSERLADTLMRLAGSSATEITDGLLEAVSRFTGTAEPSDDRTVVVLKACEAGKPCK